MVTVSPPICVSFGGTPRRQRFAEYREPLPPLRPPKPPDVRRPPVAKSPDLVCRRDRRAGTIGNRNRAVARCRRGRLPSHPLRICAAIREPLALNGPTGSLLPCRLRYGPPFRAVPRRRWPPVPGRRNWRRPRQSGHRPPDTVGTVPVLPMPCFPGRADDSPKFASVENRNGRFRHGIFPGSDGAPWCAGPCSVFRFLWGAHMIATSPTVRRAVSRRPGRVRAPADVGPIHDARCADRPAYHAGQRHTSVVDWHAVAARLAARFPAGHDARAEFDGFVSATMVIDAANGSSVTIPDPDYTGGLI